MNLNEVLGVRCSEIQRKRREPPKYGKVLGHYEGKNPSHGAEYGKVVPAELGYRTTHRADPLQPGRYLAGIVGGGQLQRDHVLELCVQEQARATVDGIHKQRVQDMFGGGIPAERMAVLVANDALSTRRLPPEPVFDLEAFKRECARAFWVRRHKFKGSSPDLRDKQHARTVHMLRRMGWFRLGSGLYSEVWEHRNFPGYVLKISGRGGWGQYHQYSEPSLDAWPIYARHCQAHPHPQLPKILHFQQVSRGMSWAIMPKYAPFSALHEQPDGLLARAVQCRMEGWLGSSAVGGAPDWVWPLQTMCEGLGCAVDLHEGNLMIDPVSGWVVITDPFSTSSDLGDGYCEGELWVQ